MVITQHSTAQKVLQFTQQQLAQVGIKVELTAMDAGQRTAQVEEKGQKESGICLLQLVKRTGHH